MGHQSRNHKESKNNYPSGDNSGGQTYLSLLPRVISSGIIKSKNSALSFFSSEALHRAGASLAIFSSAFLIALLVSSSFAPVQNSSADTITTNIDNSGYYVSVTSHDVTLDLVSTPDGATVVGKDTVTTETNSPTGFKLYISTNSTNANSNRMVHTNGENYIPAIGGTTSSPQKLDINTWGYSLTSVPQNSGTVTASSYFIGMPLLDHENLVQTVTSAVPTGSGATVDVYFGAKANTALPSGAYTSTVVYTVLAEGSPAYNGEVSVSPTSSLMNGGGTLTVATGVYTNANDLGTITVSVGGQTCANPTATRTGTNGSINITCTLPDLSTQVVGWKTVSVSMSKFGKSYSIKEGVKYYKHWNDMQYMQDMSDIACNEVSTPAASATSVPEKTLTDYRDGYQYTIRKLKDGNCWMVNNLRLTFKNGYGLHSDGHSQFTLTSDNSDFTTQTSWDGGGHTTETSANHTVWYSSFVNPDNLPKSYTFEAEKSYYDDTAQYKGTLYNWFVATAGKGVYNVSAETTIEDSICPKNWRLPINGDINVDKSWAKLLAGTGSSSDMVAWSVAIRTVPYSPIRIGDYSGPAGDLADSSVGFWWSATAGSKDGAYRLSISMGAVRPQGTDGKGWGFSVRCVSR